ncbi:hypothetical protein TraAM80_03218 [Trypanosoma rangeli]|uniref:Uncharacterized protein n=1 Tax=Trypanosoma rangeli TaxID=5698 RepID=A0A3R7L4W3_TRYRA|nr:uncharacterized protein TraAM80_03218 [Trypanosoma rangeli]RNF07696.1 hypothetical protein TraAM80_03218 [Trypanosoma rangeli]|eukprot:RNF07696.1 hypothetical protein TraAM80_03218 [Trypanosoma rangeli]
MQDNYRSPLLAAASPPCMTVGVAGSSVIVASPVSQPCEGAVIGDDYVRMLLRTIRGHDAEKLALVQRIEDCVKPERAETQRLRRELAKHDQEIVKLQQDLSEARLMLQEERERANRLLHENTVLHAQVEDERMRLTSLICLHQEAKGAFTAGASEDAAKADGRRRPHGGDVRPSSTPVTGKSRLNLPFHRNSNKSADRTRENGTMSLRQAVLHPSSAAGEDGLNVAAAAAVQAALQPPPSSTLVTALSEEVQMLQEQLDAQRATYELERTKRLREERERTRQHAEDVARYIATIDHLHALHQKSLADLIHSRHDMRVEQQELRGTIEKLRISLDEALAVAENDRRRYAADLQLMQRRVGDNADTILRRLRHELGECRAVTTAEKEQLAALLTAREAEIEQVRGDLKRAKQREKRLEERHRLDLDGVNSEVNLMRQAIRAMEKRVYYSQCRSLSA